MDEKTVYGEAIASDSQLLEVECHQLYAAPPFGSFVRAECVGSGLLHFAVVTRVCTGPLDGHRVVQAHRLPPGELEQRKPHLSSVLRTTFQARLVGYGRDGMSAAGTAPVPPRLHCYVYPAAPEEIRSVTSSPDFLRPLTQLTDVPLQDLLVSAIKAAREAWENDAQLIVWGKYLARVLRGDYVTLESVFQRLTPPVTPLSPVRKTGAQAPAAPFTHARAAGWEAPLPVAGNGSPRNADPFED